MPIGLTESFTDADRLRLREAMNWVIPEDVSPGAGSDAGVKRLLELIDSQESDVAAAYQRNLPGLAEDDLADPANLFAAMFIEHVRDAYYGHPETGSWADVGFIVTG